MNQEPEIEIAQEYEEKVTQWLLSHNGSRWFQISKV